MKNRGVFMNISILAYEQAFDFYGIMIHEWCKELARAWKEGDRVRVKYCRQVIHEYEKELQDYAIVDESDEKRRDENEE